MVYADIENLVGIELKNTFKKKIVNILKFDSEDEILSIKDVTIFFPDPAYLSLRFFDLPFGGKKAKDTCEIEISSEEIFQNEKYLIWTPHRSGTSIVIIYEEDDYVRKLLGENRTILFKPICLLDICRRFPSSIACDISDKTLSIAFSENGKIRLGFFRYAGVDDIKFQIALFLSQKSEKDNVRFKVCGSRYYIFPFECDVIKPSDISQFDIDDPAYTALICAAEGKYPKILLSQKSKSNMEGILTNTLQASIFSFASATLFIISTLTEFETEKSKSQNLTKEIYDISQEVLGDVKIVDPYTQLRLEYSKISQDGKLSNFPIFLEFVKGISDYVIRIEDFTAERMEISAQLKIREISYVDKIKENLQNSFDDIKITSTIRSREGDSFIMRLTGKYKYSKNSKLESGKTSEGTKQ